MPAGKAVSACQIIAGSRPLARRSARAMSRSRLMPGKTTTADFMVKRAGPSFDLDVVILDQGIGQKLVGCLLERSLRRLAVASLDLDVEHLALAHTRHAGDAERLERTLDRLALGIEDSGFEGDGD